MEGKYRIIEDEVPATQLWWDGNDANEFALMMARRINTRMPRIIES